MNDPTSDSPIILFVDDEAAAVKYFQRAVGAIGKVVTAESVEEGKRLLALHGDTLCVLISDQRMPGAYGNELLEYAKEYFPQIVRILTTAYSEIEHTVEAVNQGQIYRYIAKPWDIANLRLEVKQALDFARLGKERDWLVREKIQVTGKQILMNRIAAIDSLCRMLSSSGILATDVYLGLAKANRQPFGEPDWLIHDLVDVIADESHRFALFGRRVSEAVTRFASAGLSPSTLLASQLGDLIEDEAKSNSGKGQITVRKSRTFSEFVDLPLTADISDGHVGWLAALIWLGNQNKLPFYTCEGMTNLLCFDENARTDPQSLATWLDNWSE